MNVEVLVSFGIFRYISISLNHSSFTWLIKLSIMTVFHSSNLSASAGGVCRHPAAAAWTGAGRNQPALLHCYTARLDARHI